MKKVVLSIAGSDPSGGAGIQADIKVAMMLGVYPCSVITAVTAQNTSRVSGVWEVSEKQLQLQMDSVLSDIIPDAVKIGLLPSADSVKLIADIIRAYNLKNIIVDPILSLTQSKFAPSRSLIKAYCKHLFPLATLVTPNLPEQKCFEQETELPFEALCDAFLQKGGHSEENECCDKLFVHSPSLDNSVMRDVVSTSFIVTSSPFPTMDPHPYASLSDEESSVGFGNTIVKEFYHKRITTKNTHGTGCILSTAIACYLALANNLEGAVAKAIDFTDDALLKSASEKIGNGDYGPALI